MSNFIYIMGKSSAGKDTIYSKLKDKIQTNLYVPYTTRPKREGEENGIQYFFKTKEEIEQLSKSGKIMESRNYNVINAQGQKDVWTYATVYDEQFKKQGDYMSIGTLESYTSILKYLKENPEKNINMIPVYISIDEEERKRRATERENKQAKPNYEEMNRRLQADNIDFSDEKLKEANIGKKQTFENYDLDLCVENIVKYVEKEIEKKKTLSEKYKVKIEKEKIITKRNIVESHIDKEIGD